MPQHDISLDIGLEGFQSSSAQLDAMRGKLQGFGASGTSAMGGLTKALGAVGLAIGVFEGLRRIVTESISAFSEFEDALLSLQSITGVNTEGLQFYSDAALKIGTSTQFAAAETVKAFELIGSAQPALLKNETALLSVTNAAIKLAEASGMTLPEAATNLTDAMNQFGASAGEASTYINVLAAGSLEGAAAIPQVTQALLKFGAVAKQSKVSIQESTAAIEVLGGAGLKGAEAGTALRNVLLRLSAADALPKEAIASLQAAGVDMAKLGDKTISLADRLDELGKISGDQTALVKIFGAENVVAGQVILGNTDKLRDLTAAVTGTNTAYEQAAIRTQSLSTVFEVFRNKLNAGFIQIGQKIAPVVRGIFEGIEVAFNKISPLVVSVGKTFMAFNDAIKALITSIFGAGDAGDTFSLIMDGLVFSMNAVIKPTQWILQGITWLIGKFIDIKKSVDNFLDGLGLLGDALKILLNPLGALRDGIGLVVDGFNSLVGATEKWTPTAEYAIGTLGGMSGAMKAFATATGATADQVAVFRTKINEADYSSLSLSEQVALLKANFESFRETLDETGNAVTATTGIYGKAKASLDELQSAFDSAKTAAEQTEIGKQIRAITKQIEEMDKRREALSKKDFGPPAGSLKALNDQLSVLNTKLQEAGTLNERLSILGNIDEVEGKIRAINQELTLSLWAGKVIPVEIETRGITEFGQQLRDLAPIPGTVAASFNDMAGAVNLAMGSVGAAFIDGSTQMEASRGIIGTVIDSIKDQMGSLKEIALDVRDALVQGFGDIAFSLGQAIAGTGAAMDAFRQFVELLLVKVPKLVGFALLNQAAAVPSPASLPLAIAGLALIGLSGLVSGILGKKGAAADAAKEAQSAAIGGTTGSQAGQLPGLSGFGAGESKTDINIQVNLDGQALENAMTNVFENGQEVRGRR
jgi:TP901 family phage tail tape measure protein